MAPPLLPPSSTTHAPTHFLRPSSFTGAPHCFGSVIIDELREGGFKGVACIITADQDDLQRLGEGTGTDLAVAKSVELNYLAQQLLQLASRASPHSVDTRPAGTRALPPHRLPGTSTPPVAAAAVATTPLVDLSHFTGMDPVSLQPILRLAFEPSPTHAHGTLAAALVMLQTAFRDGAEIDRAAHHLFGAARTAGAALLGQEIKDFRANPTTIGLESMWSTLEATRRKMREDGYLPPLSSST